MFFETFFSQKNFCKISKKIHEFSPDLIWSHSVLRFVGPSGMKAIKNSKLPHYMMHHDLGLFTPFPSKTQTISDIPQQKSWQAWWKVRRNFSDGMKNIFKLWLVSRIWKKIPENTLHFIPSEFMKPIVKNYANDVEIFPHTLMKK